ncbi:MAG: hypothetical protein KDK54_22845 [Leptospiraceae bacterium]|nr:hypothetical protein [Leptospiraceae bacterium]
MEKDKKGKIVKIKKEQPDFSIFTNLLNSFLKMIEKKGTKKVEIKARNNSTKKGTKANLKKPNARENISLKVANTDPEDPNSGKIKLKDETIAFMLFSNYGKK